MPNPATKVSQHQQQFLSSSTTNHFKTNIEQSLNFNNTKFIQQFGDERLAMVGGGWDRKNPSYGMLGNRDTRREIWRTKMRESGDVSERN